MQLPGTMALIQAKKNQKDKKRNRVTRGGGSRDSSEEPAQSPSSHRRKGGSGEEKRSGKKRSREGGQDATHTVATTEGEEPSNNPGKQSDRPKKGGNSKDAARKKPKPPPKLSAEAEGAIDRFLGRYLKVSVEALHDEWVGLKLYAPPSTKADAHARNLGKNRYQDIICWDETRVILKTDYGNYTAADGDYIHANWITMPDVDRKYIATQGPKQDTIEDFWRMVFQENSSCVLCVTDLLEGGVEKCCQYWPEKQGSYQNYGKMFVNNKKVETQEGVATVYTLEILPDSCSNSIITKLVHCTNWPDKSATSGRLVNKLRVQVKETGTTPCIVHCSAGVGRTGTFIAIELVIAKLLKGRDVTVPEVFTQLRQCRASSIQSEQQYMFIYTTVLDYLAAKKPSETTRASLNLLYDQIAKYVDQQP
ncbi:unnamed protein product, partial [Mesorhabditis spiculigera]